MISAALVSLALLQAATPQSNLANRIAQADGTAGMSQTVGPVLAGDTSSEAQGPIPLRFGQIDASGCLHAPSNGSYCRHMGIATDGASLLAVGGLPVLRAADGSVNTWCGWALNVGGGGSLYWTSCGLDPAAYTSWVQAPPACAPRLAARAGESFPDSLRRGQPGWRRA